MGFALGFRFAQNAGDTDLQRKSNSLYGIDRYCLLPHFIPFLRLAVIAFVGRNLCISHLSRPFYLTCVLHEETLVNLNFPSTSQFASLS